MQRKDGTLVDRREMLRVKLKSLATEAKYIRSEEDRKPTDSIIRMELRSHRVKDVRVESRATGLAYGFVKGYKRSQVENKHHPLPDWMDKDLKAKVIKMVEKYGPVPRDKTLSDRIAQWWSGDL